jgi:hypothetical protein
VNSGSFEIFETEQNFIASIAQNQNILDHHHSVRRTFFHMYLKFTMMYPSEVITSCSSKP